MLNDICYKAWMRQYFIFQDMLTIVNICVSFSFLLFDKLLKIRSFKILTTYFFTNYHYLIRKSKWIKKFFWQCNKWWYRTSAWEVSIGEVNVALQN